jgi:succinoglycan biosynthesis protein ExoM
MQVLVAIPTCRRPEGLTVLLQSLVSQTSSEKFDILVCDNAPTGSATQSICESFQVLFTKGCFFVEPVMQRGISPVRNRMLDFAFMQHRYDVVLMVDDDEIAEPDWLEKILSFYQANKYDVVGGRVRGVFPANKPAWVSGLALYWDTECTSGPVDLIEGTGNVLISRDIIQASNERFDLSYALSGGGDREFFYRLKKHAGATFGLCAEAQVNEPIPDNRLTLKWALQRAYRIGAADLRIGLKHERSIGYWLVHLFKSLAALLAGGLYGLLFIFGYARAIRGLLLFVRQLGKCSAVFGIKYLPYLKTDGQ